MKKKILITTLLIIIMIQAIIPIKSYATSETEEVETGTGFGDTIAGIIIEPTVEFLTLFIDAIMAVVSDFMMPDGDGIQFVMVNDINQVSDIGEKATEFTIDDITPYKNGFGVLDIRYPNFRFSAEDIFAGKVELLNVDFISGNAFDGEPIKDEGWKNIREVIASWYQVLRMVTIIGLLSILIYTGIKIILSSTANDKAKYKEMIVNWFIAVVLAFSLHYIMAFIMNVAASVMTMLQGVAGVIEVTISDKVFNTNLIGLARFQMQQQHFSAKISYLIIYTALVVYTLKFTFIYFKRVLYMAFLTIISPIVALTYPIDKMDGKAKGFEMWLKEYMYNVLLQPMHYVLYYVLVTTSLSLAANNIIYGIAALAFVSNAEKLLKKIFGIDKAKEGTVNGLSRAFTTGAMVGALNNAVRDPLHPFGNGKKSKGGKGGKGGKNNNDLNSYLDNPKPIYGNDWSEFDDIGGTLENPNNFLEEGEEENNSEETDNQEEIDNTEELEQEEQAQEEELNEGEQINGKQQFWQSGTPEEQAFMLQYSENPQLREIFEGLNDKERATLQRYIAEGFTIDGNGDFFNPYTSEFDGEYTPFEDERFTGEGGTFGIPDMVGMAGVAGTAGMARTTQMANSANQTPGVSRAPIREMAEQREAEHQSQNQNQNQNRNENENQNRNQNQNQDENTEQKKVGGFKGGMKAVGKYIAKPVWDFDKGAKYNGKRLARGIAKGVLGTAAGITAATVQAGISITDGKYKAGEGIATFAAGYAGMTGLVNGIGKTEENIKDAIAEGDKKALMKRAQERFGDRDDVIKFNKQEFAEDPKGAMQRQRDNYLPRGITDLGQMKQCMNYANVLMEQHGMSAEAADRRAATTFEFRRKLQERGQLPAVYSQKKRDKYIDILVKQDVETGTTEEDTARRRYLNAFKAVQEFDIANQ